MPQEQQNSLFSKSLATKSKTFFFDVKAAKNGNKYLTITESRIKDGQKFRNSIMVFSDTLQDFSQAILEMQEKVKTA